MSADSAPVFCPGRDCEEPCGPGICKCKPCACPTCLQRTARARYGRLAPRPGRPTQLVLVRDTEPQDG